MEILNNVFQLSCKDKKMILRGECVGFKVVETYHGISLCMLLFFKDGSQKPIRKHRFEEYFFLLAKYEIKNM